MNDKRRNNLRDQHEKIQNLRGKCRKIMDLINEHKRHLAKQEKMGNISEEDLMAKQESISLLEIQKCELEEKTQIEIGEIDRSIAEIKHEIK